MNSGQDVNPLVSLGFTDLEARIYMHLLGQYPVTGYVVAKALGKPVANTYKALESLERKGAILVEEGDHRLCRPVSPAVLLRQLDQRFQQNRSRADEILASLHQDSRDDRVYRLKSTDQVLEKSRSILQQAREVVLIDAFPETLSLLEDPIASASERGVLVAVKAYAPTTIEGAIVVVGSGAAAVRQRWPGTWLNMVADGAEYMMALLTTGGEDVVQAVWTECPFLAWVHQSAFSSEIILAALSEKVRSGASTLVLQATLKDLSRLKMLQAPGYRSALRELEQKPPTEGAR